jgi:hypothetical protein
MSNEMVFDELGHYYLPIPEIASPRHSLALSSAKNVISSLDV